MPRLLLIGLLMSLCLTACADRNSDLPPAYRDVAVPVFSPASVARGRQLFLDHCALCHGERGDGHGVRREGLSSPPRDFTNETWRRSTSPRHVYFAIREGLAGTPMPAWKALTRQDAWDLTAYVLSLAGPS